MKRCPTFATGDDLPHCDPHDEGWLMDGPFVSNQVILGRDASFRAQLLKVADGCLTWRNC